MKDKNGKEIYEGDIITVNRNKKTKGFLYVVSWERHGWLARPILNDSTPSLALQWYNEFDEKKIEVVGNIYDNKELLIEK